MISGGSEDIGGVDVLPLPEVGEFTSDMTLDLSKQGIEKLGRATDEGQLSISTLILDANNLQRMDNIHTYQCLEKVNEFANQQ